MDNKSDGIFGKWVNGINQRCDYCDRPSKRVMVVADGDCTGKFCSIYCYENAKMKMLEGNK